MQRGVAQFMLGALGLMTACGGDAKDTPRERAREAMISEAAAALPSVAAPDVAAPDIAAPDVAPAAPMSVDEASPEGIAQPPSADVDSPSAPDDTADAEDPPSTPVAPDVIVEACHVIGGFDRLVVKQHDLTHASCTEVVLVSPPYQDVPPGLTMPERWGLEDTWRYPCTSDGELLPEGEIHTFDAVTGVIALTGEPPRSAQLDLSLPGDALDGASRRLLVPELEVSRVCTTYGPTR